MKESRDMRERAGQGVFSCPPRPLHPPALARASLTLLKLHAFGFWNLHPNYSY